MEGIHSFIHIDHVLVLEEALLSVAARIAVLN